MIIARSAVIVFLCATPVIAQTPLTAVTATASSKNPPPPARQEIDFIVGFTDGAEVVDSGGELPGIPTGYFSQIDTQVAYSRRWSRSTLTATGFISDRYYPLAGGSLFADGQGSVSGQTSTSRSDFRAAASLRYSPYRGLDELTASPISSLNLVAAAGASGSLVMDNRLLLRPGVTQVVAAEMTHRFDRRSSLTINYEFRGSDFGDPRLNFRADTVHAAFMRALNRYAKLRLGYGQQIARYGITPGGLTAQRNTRNQNLDVGIEYDRPLSFSRQTFVSVRSGSSIVSAEGYSRYNIAGEVAVKHQITRKWAGRLTYQRGVQTIEGVPAPLFAEEVRVVAAGRLARRITLDASGGLSWGTMGVVRLSAYRGETITGRLRASLTPHLSLEAQYGYSRYEFSDDALLFSTPYLRRNGLRGGLVWSAVKRP